MVAGTRWLTLSIKVCFKAASVVAVAGPSTQLVLYFIIALAPVA